MKRTFSMLVAEGGDSGSEKENSVTSKTLIPESPSKPSAMVTLKTAPANFDYTAFSVIAVQASARLNCAIDLRRLARLTENAEFKGSCTVLRLRKPFTTCRVTVTGCLGVTGARSIEDAEEAMLHFARKTRKAGHPGIKSIFGFHITTMSAGARFPHRISLSQLLTALQRNESVFAHWNPEMTPNLHCKMKDLGVTVSVSSKGYIKVDGGTSKETTFKALVFIHPYLVASHYAM